MSKNLTKNLESNNIFIKGARQHNLKNVDVSIPRNKLVVVTGVSGSGKSSLAIDTLYAEGQRRYVESLSSYARQFLDRMDKPQVDYIKGLSPAIAIEQKTTTGTTRSTVGTLTEIYDFLRLLYARVGKTYSPISNQQVIKHTVQDVLDFIFSLEEDQKIQILAPLSDTSNTKLATLQKDGIARLLINDTIVALSDVKENISNENVYILIDRATANASDENRHRLADSINLAFVLGNGDCVIDIPKNKKVDFNNKFELDGMLFEEPSPQFFNFNSPYGACPTCEGFGTILGIDKDLVIPNKNLSVYEDAVVAWKGESMSWWKKQFIKGASTIDFPIHKPIAKLSKEQNDILWKGAKGFHGINDFFKDVESQAYKIQYRVLLSRYRGRATCTDCHGSRLRPDSFYVKINQQAIGNLLQMSIKELYDFFNNLTLNEHDAKIANRLLVEINNRLRFMIDVGLDYLTLSRFSNTLSGGETQRINLTRSLGSNLTNALYILDEPSVGLHPQDTTKLISVLQYLRDLGNTVIVVEHEEAIILQADYLIDVGPFAGYLGGEIVYAGDAKKIKDADTLTTKYITEQLSIPIPTIKAKPNNFITIEDAYLHNLKNIDVKIPLHALTVVSGVSGSGKTTLVKQILYPAIKSVLEEKTELNGQFKSIEGFKNHIQKIEFIDQNPIGRSSRSNPVTYIKAYDAIRDLYGKQALSKIRAYQPKHFSFNVDGGRCDACKGEGEQIVEMQFLADVHLECEVCKGKRFKEEILEVKYKDKNIADVLDLTVDEAIIFFQDQKDIQKKLQPLQDVGLGYIKLGQSSSTISGGEAQRVKLAAFLTKANTKESILFIFDEPTTGLHFHDINKLLDAFYALIQNGHTIVVVEHNLEVIKCADWMIDLGPKGGDEGGQLCFQGKPEDSFNSKSSITAQYLKSKFKK